ncbi:fumarylacetoacetate hydrolase [Pseudomonas gingeri]
MGHYLMLLDLCQQEHRGIGLFDFQTGRNARLFPEQGGLYETLQYCSRWHLGWADHLKSLPASTSTREISLRPPLKPANNLLAQVSAVSLATPKRNQAWFYKGNGSLLKTDGEALNIPYHALSIASEPGIVCVYMVDPFGKLRFVGFTLGNEVQDPLLGNLDSPDALQASLRECAIAPAMILGEMQCRLSINARIERLDAQISSREYVIELKEWQALRRYTQAFLEQHEQFLQPGMLHYVFHGLERRDNPAPLQHGDWLDLDCPELELGMSNRIVEEELLHLYPLGKRLVDSSLPARGAALQQRPGAQR